MYYKEEHFFAVRKQFILRSTFVFVSRNTFEEVQKKSDQVWKYERYDLVIEYSNRPGLVPPFMILAHVWSMVTYVYRRYYQKKTPQIRNELRKSHTSFLSNQTSYLRKTNFFTFTYSITNISNLKISNCTLVAWINREE